MDENKTFIYDEWRNDKFNLPAANAKFVFESANIVNETSIERLSIGDQFSKVIGIDEQISVDYIVGAIGSQIGTQISMQKGQIVINNSAYSKNSKEKKTLVIVVLKSVFLNESNVWKTSNLKDISTGNTILESPPYFRKDLTKYYDHEKSVEYVVELDSSKNTTQFDYTIMFEKRK